MTDYINPARKIAYHAAHIAALQRGEMLPPVNVEIDLTNRCSLGCSWCHFAYTHTKGPLAGKRDKPEGAEDGGDEMTLVMANYILNQLADNGVQSVTWTGGGEPTLHPAFYDIVEANWLPQGVYTHGGHIDAIGASILKQHCKWVYVSLDECNVYAYHNSKGVDRFDAACDGIRRLVAAEGGATIGVGFLLHENNYEQTDDMIALAKSLGADYVQFRPTVRYNMAHPAFRAEDGGWAAIVAQRMQRHEDYHPLTISGSQRFWDYATWDGHGYETCYWSAMQTVITPNGKMWTCVNKREFSGHCLGDLSRETFADIWARHTVAKVDGSCRVMCRGHEGNVALHGIMARPVHAEFP